MQAANSSVLIVGAGPSGLALALTLLQNGVKPRIIQKDLDWRVGQKGTGIQPRTLELYRFLGLHRDITHLGDFPQDMRMYHPGTKTAVKVRSLDYVPSSPDCPDMNVLMLGQDRHEAVIRAHLEKYGCTVERGTELKNLKQQDENTVEVELHKTGSAPAVEIAKFDWVVGCDGGSSIVRKLLGLQFLGETSEEDKVLVGDIEVLSGIDRDFWHRWGTPSTKMASLRPYEDPTSKCFNFMIGGRKFESEPTATTREEFIKLFQETSGITDIEFGRLLYIGKFAPNVRMVDNPRKGRVFVAGDAFHCHPPTGGQGLNTSVQDSANLGWKLALVCKGLAPQTLLDTYGSERIPVIASMLSKTSDLMNQTLKIGEATENTAWVRGMELRQMGVTYRGSSILVDESPSATPDEEIDPYRSGSSGGIIRAGDRAPDAPGIVSLQGLDAKSLFRLFKPSHHVVLVFDSDPFGQLQGAVAEIVKAYSAPIVTAVVIPDESTFDPKEQSRLAYVLEDHQGYAYKYYKAETPELKIVVVRPDGVVGAVVAGVVGLKKYFNLILSL